MSRKRFLIESARFLFVLGLLFALGNPALSAESRHWEEADRLLQSPGLNFTKARQALMLYETLHPQADTERALQLVRMARTCFILGDLAENNERLRYYEQGQRYAEVLRQKYPEAVEGHYWLALHLCGLADVKRGLRSLRQLPRILQLLQRALAIDETYDQAGAHRVMGRIYYEAPGWPLSVGNLRKSLEHLTAAVRLAPETSTNHLFLAETLIRLNRPAQALVELERVLNSTRHAIHPRGLKEDQQDALRHLAALQSMNE